MFEVCGLEPDKEPVSLKFKRIDHYRNYVRGSLGDNGKIKYL